jgi:hypothetical protein
MKGLGDSSAHWLFANLAIETGISPRELIALSPRMLWTIQRALESRAQESNRARKGRR